MTPRSTLGRALILLGLVVATAVFLAVIPGHRGWFDVGVYYETVQHWAHGGQIYEYRRPGTMYGFTYPPFAALCMLPLTLVGWHTAIAIDVAVSTLASAALLYWLFDPIARRQGWNRWFSFGIAACLFAILNPVRDTVSFGQINLLLMGLVFADFRQLTHGRGRFAGIGIGLAAALKLTPLIFIGYLAITRRRSALTATVTALVATAVGHLAAPQASRFFWTDALWDTHRVGALAYVSNQSLQGMVARFAPSAPSRIAWVAGVLVVLGVWAVRAYRAARRGDQRTGFALTGLASCLVSPITWVHHLVWTLPALLLLADAGLRSTDRARRRRLLTAAGAAYVVLTSGVVWLWPGETGGQHGLSGFFGSNAYLLISLALLFGLPAGDRVTEPAPTPPLPPAADAALPAQLPSPASVGSG
ncbi:glycosyltransferase family 87 protein [Kitasatospora nipponensis]|uniref:glycosyltransferase family 87 protein n=1 Tax=Kitasatospora nipponensis TaxID=258049 RepID=UPI0031D2B6BF